MRSITILHPFTPKAAGVVEKSVPVYHSQPQLKALEYYARTERANCAMEYFTSRFRRYSVNGKYVHWNFYPVKFTIRGDHKKWRKQFSGSCRRQYHKDCPDVTIINTSGHASEFCFDLSKLILAQNKNYIAMFGGKHYTDTPWRREYFRNAHHLLVHTQRQKVTMETMEMFKGLDIRVFPLGVDCSVFKPIESKEGKKGPALLFVGRITELKRIQFAIECVRKLRDQGFPKVKLRIIGPVVSKVYLASLQNLIQSHQLKDNVEFLGHKDHEELVAYYNQSDMLLLPSSTESFGMVMIESMACGVPVAAVQGSGGPDEVIRHGFNGVLATNEEQYADDVAKLFQDKNQLDNLKKNCRAWVIENYDIDITCQLLKKSVEDCLRS